MMLNGVQRGGAAHSLCSLQNRTTQPEGRKIVGGDGGIVSSSSSSNTRWVMLSKRRRGGGRRTRHDGADWVGVVVYGEEHLLRVKMHELAAWARVGSLRRQQRAAVEERVVVGRTWICT